MFNKFQILVNTLLENNTAGSGGALGTPQQAIFNPPVSISSADTYAQEDARNVMGGVFPLQGKKKGKKKSKKQKPLVIKRNLQRNSL
jgi:hypothetical protein